MKFKQLLRTVPRSKEMGIKLVTWSRSSAKFWGVSVGMHVLVLLVLGAAVGAPTAKKFLHEAIYFDAEVETTIEEPPLAHFDLGEAPLEPTELSTDSLTEPPSTLDHDVPATDDAAMQADNGGDTGSSITAPFGTSNSLSMLTLGPGPAVHPGSGPVSRPGKSEPDDSLNSRVAAKKGGGAGSGVTKDTEQAVAAGVRWLARHQNIDGSWGCQNFARQCQDANCLAHGNKTDSPDYPMAATAFGLLPYLASGQTHDSKGPYQKTILNGLRWMSAHQDPQTGRMGVTMYEHGLATIAVCEAYGLSRDSMLKPVAQRAVDYIQTSQHSEGGWRYGPNQPGDVSVVGWQMMALKSAQMAKLTVSRPTLDNAQRFLKSCASGKSGGLFAYMPDGSPTPTMSAVGLLCNQYSGMKRNDPAMVEGMSYVMENLPATRKNAYFLYYATQVMHNLPGPEWDTWNRSARRMLIESQIKEGCAAGSWSSAGNAHAAGPVMVTSIHTLTLEVYYRYLPLYQIDKSE